MSEKPILGPMIRAILSGAKTQTRRIVKPSRSGCTVGAYTFEGHPEDTVALNVNADGSRGAIIRCPYGEPGDKLWVREKFFICALEGRGTGNPFVVFPDEFVDGIPRPSQVRPYFDDLSWGPHPSIHMPRWASRITLEITEVRVQRVQEISGHDAISEGVGEIASEYPDLQPTELFRELWNSINGKKAPWESNPWVWAITFRRCA